MYDEKIYSMINEIAKDLKDDCIKFIQRLIKTPSISGDEQKLADIIVAEMEALGMMMSAETNMGMSSVLSKAMKRVRPLCIIPTWIMLPQEMWLIGRVMILTAAKLISVNVIMRTELPRKWWNASMEEELPM